MSGAEARDSPHPPSLSSNTHSHTRTLTLSLTYPLTHKLSHSKPLLVSTRYFVVYIYFGVFFLQALLLAVIVSIYLERAGSTVTKERKKEWKALVTAFKVT